MFLEKKEETGVTKMKFVCDRQALLDAVNNVQRAVSGKSLFPSLEACFCTPPDRLFLAGYDLDLGVHHHDPGEQAG